MGDILVIAAIALFIILRYRAMLGEDRGRNNEDFKRDAALREAQALERVIQLPQRDAAKATAKSDAKTYPEPLASQFTQIKNIDSEFEPEHFIEGASAAFDMVLKAFNEADHETLRELLDPAIYKNFDAELKQREAENKYPQITLLAIKSAEITKVQLTGALANISVNFASEQMHQIKDKSGTILSGENAQIEHVEDEWQFSRNLTSKDPAWLITQT
jgi:predicted lipid-binding transport protein (Tim44 family)